MTDMALEVAKRQALMKTLAEEFRRRAVLTTDYLTSVDFGWGPERVKDASRGIWNPRSYAATLSIVSDPHGEYDDGPHEGSLFRYAYERRPEGQDPLGGSNSKLREAMRLGLPIVMLRKVADAQFVPVMPVYVVHDEPRQRRFLLALDEGQRTLPDSSVLDAEATRYWRRVTADRLNSGVFRSLVLTAYGLKCAICGLGVPELIVATRIGSDRDGAPSPSAAHGLSLCALHDAAYRSQLLAVSPDFQVHLSAALLTPETAHLRIGAGHESETPRIRLPARRRDWPDSDRLAQDFDSYLSTHAA